MQGVNTERGQGLGPAGSTSSVREAEVKKLSVTRDRSQEYGVFPEVWGNQLHQRLSNSQER